jgi:LacI family transcriptional regulator
MATIYEIAKLAKVSIGTVDRVIHKRGRVSKATEDKVNRIIHELDYKPSVYARGLALSRTFCFDVLMPRSNQDGGYWHLAEIGIQKALEQLDVYGIQIRNVFYDKYSHRSFQEACQTVLNQVDDTDAILIAPVLSKDAEQFIRQIPPMIPYVFFDSYLTNAKNLSFIGQNSLQSGIVSAKLMGMIIRGGGPVAVVNILPEDYHLLDRIKGFQSFFLKNFKNPLIQYTADLSRNEDELVSLTQVILDENPEIEGIFVPHACIGQMARFLYKHSTTHRIHLIGYDLTHENREFLEKGVLDFLISQHPETQGYRGIYSLYRHVVLKEKVENSIIMPIDIIMRENFNDQHIEP